MADVELAIGMDVLGGTAVERPNSVALHSVLQQCSSYQEVIKVSSLSG